MNKIAEPHQRLRELLALAGDSQSDMVRKTGIEKSTVSYYVSGNRVPRQDNLYKISKAYGVNPAWLMGLDVEMYDDKTAEKQNIILEYAKKIMALKESDREIVTAQIDFLTEREKHGN